MKWNQFRLKTTTEAEDIVSSMLADLGIEGVQIEDKIPLTQSDKEQMFVDILPDIPEDDGCAYLTFYLDEDVDKQELLLKVRQELEEMRSYLNVGECTIEESQTEDVDWVNNWKQYFHQFYIDDILVIPSWENVEAKDSDKMVIHIDPGTAFGTGMHETTQLCIRQLKKYVTEDTEILDVGCGSGILGMLALKFGAKHSVGTDLDPCAIDATYENMDNNGISRDQYEVMIGNIIDDKAVQDKVGYEKYDIVAANILADVLVPLTPVIIHQMKKGGIYITSGIIEDKEDVVVKAVGRTIFHRKCIDQLLYRTIGCRIAHCLRTHHITSIPTVSNGSFFIIFKPYDFFVIFSFFFPDFGECRMQIINIQFNHIFIGVICILPIFSFIGGIKHRTCLIQLYSGTICKCCSLCYSSPIISTVCNR